MRKKSGGGGFVSQGVRPHVTGAVILSTLLTGKYYTPNLSPLMSHTFWTITTVEMLLHGMSDRWRS